MNSKTFSSILVPIDGSAPSIEAADYAISSVHGGNKLTIYVLHISGVQRYAKGIGLEGKEYDSAVARMRNEIEARAETWFRSIKSKAEARGLLFKTEVVDSSAPVGDTILDYAKQHNIDLIVISARGASNSNPSSLIGSVTFSVLSYASCPVLLTR